MKKLILISMIIAFAGCNVCKRAEKKGCITNDTISITTIKDSIVYKDTTIYVPMPTETLVTDTMYLTVVNNNVKDFVKVFKSKYMTVSVNMISNKLTVEAMLNDEVVRYEIKDAIVEKFKQIVKTTIITKKVEVNKLTTWQNIRVWIGNIILIAIALLLLWMLIAIRLRRLQK